MCRFREDLDRDPAEIDRRAALCAGVEEIVGPIAWTRVSRALAKLRFGGASADVLTMLQTEPVRTEGLASDLKTLQEQVKRWLASRGRGHLIDEGQEVLFPDAPADDETAEALTE